MATGLHPIFCYRKLKGLSASEFAEQAGIDKTSLCKVETGKRDRLSADACLSIEKFTKGELSASTLLAWRWPPKKTTKTSRVPA